MDGDGLLKTIDTLAIVGLGLMGASLGLAARQRGIARRVVGSARRSETRAEALRRGVVDVACEQPGEAVREAELVVFCLPVLTIFDAIAACGKDFRRGSVVTDVGSTKTDLARTIGPLLAGTGVQFVGSHPIAGSEQTGLEAARADLYEGAVVVVTPPDGRMAPGFEAVRELWAAVGGVVETMTPEAHDRVLARTSHLPHLAAAALVRAVLGQSGEDVAGFCGSGFRDTTRVAGGSEDLWHDIVKTNGNAIGAELAAYSGELERLRDLVARGDFEGVRAFLAQARDWRKNMRAGKERGA